ncbi:unnamed protein product [Linum tenue]|uniref:Uncharacterized protein n=1 Tax=Linum tenue TaxID=586396 RepID=A0AAV0L3G5_9ROSI|nr:unnamed protein product [Linum tenue]
MWSSGNLSAYLVGERVCRRRKVAVAGGRWLSPAASIVGLCLEKCLNVLVLECVN